MNDPGVATSRISPDLRLVLVCAVAACLAVLLVLASGGKVEAAPPADAAPECARGVDFLGFSDALNKQQYEGTTVGGLSGLTYDARGGVYYGVVDNGPAATSPARFYTLEAPVRRSGLGTPDVLDVTTLRDAGGQPFTAVDFDGEGIARSRGGDLFVSSETEPSIRRFSPDGTSLRKLRVPPKFRVAPAGGGQPNQTFESLSFSPNGRILFTANEGFLAPDGEDAAGGDRIRILRYENRGPYGFVPAREFYYLAEPGQGVVEIVALPEKELLVLERGFVAGQGNTVRIFRVSLKGADDVSGEPSLSSPDLQPVEKELLVDLADCPPSGATTPGTQANPLLDNFEAVTLGPRLPSGRRTLLLVSDDNFSASQVTRVISLGVENSQLGTNGR